MIRSILQYTRYGVTGLSDPRIRPLLLAHARGVRTGKAGDRAQALEDLAAYFGLAQDHGDDDGLGSYHLVNGWSASYPETTGYIVATLIALSEQLRRPELLERAVRAMDWLLSIQLPDGLWQGGRVNEKRPGVVFNTAQVVRGCMAVHAATGEKKYLAAAARACDRMVAVQEADGSWRRHNFLQRSRVYDSYVSEPLLRMSALTDDDAYRRCAMKNLEWVLARQRPNGWFDDADNTIRHNQRPITHTIAYTIDGLIGAYLLTKDERFLIAARKPAERLLHLFMHEGRLSGRYDAGWKGSEHPICTGNAQLAICWARLHRITGEEEWKRGLQRMTGWLLAVAALSSNGPVEVKGTVPGSFPLWGRYEKFAFPNWAQKYFADALLCNEGRLPAY